MGGLSVAAWMLVGCALVIAYEVKRGLASIREELEHLRPNFFPHNGADIERAMESIAASLEQLSRR